MSTNLSVKSKKTSSESSAISKQKNLISRTLDAIMGERKELSKYWVVVKKIEALESEIQALSDDQLRQKTFEFRKQFEGLEGKDIQKKHNESKQ